MELTLGARTATPASAAGGSTGALPTPGAHSVGHTTCGLSLGFTAALEGGAHAAWGPAAEQTDALSEHAGAGAGAVQIDKWGLVPGADDTLDLNLSAQGAHAASLHPQDPERLCSPCTCVKGYTQLLPFGLVQAAALLRLPSSCQQASKSMGEGLQLRAGRQLMGEATYNNIYGRTGDTNSDAEGPTPAPAGAGGAGPALATPDSAPAVYAAPSPAAADADAGGPVGYSSAKRSSPGSLLRPGPAAAGQRLSEPVSHRGRVTGPSPLGEAHKQC